VQAAGLVGAFEVTDDDAEAALRRTVFGRGVEWEDERCTPRVLVHRHDETRLDHVFGEGNEPFGEISQHFARVGLGGIDRR
jgi:hypothetical protein